VTNLSAGPQLYYFNVRDLSQLDRQFLIERQLISKELAEGHGARGVAFDKGQSVSIMVNEEDHLRMQVVRSGFSLDECWRDIDQLDDALEESVTYAFSEEFGYLTACPTNVGTGIRVSVMLHLPALHMTKEIQKVLGALQKISLAVRGLYGEGSSASGQFFQISNQITLGQSEAQIIEKLQEVVPNIIGYERRVREALVKDNRQKLHDQISRATGILQKAQTISSEETMDLLSSVRLGVSLGMIDDLDLPTVNELFIHTQPAHLQKIRGESLDSGERNAARAAYLRSRLAEV
jgi:protein arginine kinase